MERESHREDQEYRFPNRIEDKSEARDTANDNRSEVDEQAIDYKNPMPLKKHILGSQNAAFATIDVQKHQKENLPKPIGMNQTFQYDPQRDYTKEYYRVYLANMAIMDRINTLKEDNKSLKERIDEFKSEKSSRFKTEEKREESDSNDSATDEFSLGRRKKKRRKKEEIERGFTCVTRECGKSYGYGSYDVGRRTL